MKTALIALSICSLALGGCVAKVIKPELAAELDRQQSVVASWAADPAVIAAVKEHNAKGPIAGMTNDKWSDLDNTDPIVRALETSPAGNWLSSKINASDIVLNNAYLNGAKGEKVAFAHKTAQYNHAGSARHDRPMAGEKFQGKPLPDACCSGESIAVSAPVLDGGKAIGVLTVGVGVQKQLTFVWPWDWKWSADQDKE